MDGKRLLLMNFPEFIEAVSRVGNNIAGAITPLGAAGTDATGGRIGSLTEAVMGVTAGLVRVAEALNNVAEAVREGQS